LHAKEITFNLEGKKFDMVASDRFKEHTTIPELAFPLNVFYVSEPNPLSIPLHWHDHLEWMYIRKGRFRVQVHERLEEVSEGDVVFVNTRQMHAAFPLEEGTDILAVVFNEALIRSAWDRTDNSVIAPLLNNKWQVPNILKRDDAFTPLIIACIERLSEEYAEKRLGYELLVKSELLRSIGHLYRILERSGTYVWSEKPKGTISPLLRYLSSHFQESISVAQAADICNLSPSYFCFLFKQTTGKTLIEYLNMLRVHEADRLLRETDCTVQEAANQVGYSNMTYFGRVYKRLKHIRPSDCRKLYRKKD
jgi:AraC family transcriptional regulator, transcriptional activator of pobA